jgi:hypothetical protein
MVGWYSPGWTLGEWRPEKDVGSALGRCTEAIHSEWIGAGWCARRLAKTKRMTLVVEEGSAVVDRWIDVGASRTLESEWG